MGAAYNDVNNPFDINKSIIITEIAHNIISKNETGGNSKIYNFKN